MQGTTKSTKTYNLQLRKRKVDTLLKNVDIIAESPYHFVYELAEKSDEIKAQLQEIDPKHRSSQEGELIRFIKGRSYNHGSNRPSVIDAVVPGARQISILNKLVDLDDWREWFVRVTHKKDFFVELKYHSNFLFEVSHNMAVYLNSCVKSMDKPILEDFRKLGKIFHHKYWNSRNSRDVSEEQLVWLWEKVVLVLSFIDDCPRSIRFIEKEKFVEDMRKFLGFCYDLVKGLPHNIDEKMYHFCSLT